MKNTVTIEDINKQINEKYKELNILREELDAADANDAGKQVSLKGRIKILAELIVLLEESKKGLQ